jgi:glycosidase
MSFKSIFIIGLLCMLNGQVYSQETPLIEPPFWWTNMAVADLQLMVHADGIASCMPMLAYPGVTLEKVSKTGNRDYLFLDLHISPDAPSGTVRIDFLRDEDVRYFYEYELKDRVEGSAFRKGFGPEDVILLAMPDRFSNGNDENDNMPGMLEQADRNNPDGRHGGDLEGIANHLDYIDAMGFTAIWINPLLENNNPKYSYHGYAITDFYQLDPRYGTNEEYVAFVKECHNKDIRVIMDMVFNHCGYGHWWMKNLPSEDWIHQWPEFTRSNFRAPVNSDPHAAEYDIIKMQNGWFDTNMPDLNQKNEFLANYLIQNSIWWVEYAGLDGIRMDTYPYSDQAFMARWVARMLQEYPNFNILGETWLQKEAITAYYAGSESEKFGYNSNLTSVTDFPLHYALDQSLNESESWTEGMARLYYVLAQDFLFDDPNTNVIFADNHDLTRFYTVMGEDMDKYKMGMLFLMTTRGTPMVYYGTEVLMTGEEHMGHGYIREDFPGGWPDDSVNAFTGIGLTEEQLEAQAFLKKLQNWRKDKPVVYDGALKHFIPEDGIYVYFRILEDETVMVILNNNDVSKNMPSLERFDECLKGRRQAVEVMSESELEDLQLLSIPPKSALIFEILQ